MIRMHALVTGRVQGVFFRDFTRRAALDRDLSGWVRNLADGRVEAVLEGERGAVEAMLEQLREGPEMARVEHVEYHEESPEGLDGFTVRG